MINVQFFQLFCMFEKFLNEMFGGKKSSSQHFSVFGNFSSLRSCPAPVGKKERQGEENLVVGKKP